MPESSQPEDRLPSASNGTDGMIVETDRSSSPDELNPIDEATPESRALEATELESALQLLVERAQYITGATGAALALPQDEEMVCRASAGSSAPGVGARLQVRSGLSAESIARRQLLRCDNAESDPRVNLEACRALGIASIVVLPLLHRTGEVRGLFELFSDHPYAFEERDLIALERMAELTLTALDLAEQRTTPVIAAAARREPEKAAENFPAPPPDLSAASSAPQIPVAPESAKELPELSVISAPVLAPERGPDAVPEAMLRVQKCSSCGFPVSEGRTLCLDCEKKDRERQDAHQTPSGTKRRDPEQDAASEPPSVAANEFVPAFLANAESAQASWFADHLKLLAVMVLIVAILVAVVVFR
jgi:putative methionine-R-sulfoxide reductase with GAF domain